MADALLHDYWRSSAAYRVRIGLNLLEIPYDAAPVNLLEGEQRGPANLARNPQGLVPTLELDGLVLTQSLAILEYLNDTRAAGWLPAGAGPAAQVRALAYAVAMDIHPVCNLHVVRHAVVLGGTTTEGWMQHFIAAGLAGLERMLVQAGAGHFSTGNRITLADICLVPQVYNARRWGVDLGPLPRITAIDKALSALPAFAAAHPDRVRPAA